MKLPVACCLLPVACCLLPVACCLLPVACCLLPVVANAQDDPGPTGPPPWLNSDQTLVIEDIWFETQHINGGGARDSRLVALVKVNVLTAQEVLGTLRRVGPKDLEWSVDNSAECAPVIMPHTVELYFDAPPEGWVDNHIFTLNVGTRNLGGGSAPSAIGRFFIIPVPGPNGSGGSGSPGPIQPGAPATPSGAALGYPEMSVGGGDGN